VGTPVMYEAGHFPQLLFLHEANGVGQTPLATGRDQFITFEPNFIDE